MGVGGTESIADILVTFSLGLCKCLRKCNFIGGVYGRSEDGVTMSMTTNVLFASTSIHPSSVELINCGYQRPACVHSECAICGQFIPYQHPGRLSVWCPLFSDAGRRSDNVAPIQCPGLTAKGDNCFLRKIP